MLQSVSGSANRQHKCGFLMKLALCRNQPLVLRNRKLMSDRMLLLNLFLFYLSFFFLVVFFLRSWPRRQPDNCIETEMWKQSDSDVDLGHAQEEESDRKCLGPEFRMTSE